PPPDNFRLMTSENLYVFFSMVKAAGSLVSLTIVALYAFVVFRNLSGMLIVFSVTPFITAMNQVSPFRLTYAANSPISDSGNTIVSSQVEGMALITSTEGLERI